MPESRFIFDSSIKPEKPPVLKEPLDKGQIISLLTYFRKETFADSVSGFNKCRAVNEDAVLMLKQQFSNLDVYHLYSPSVYGVSRTPGMAVEHHTGVIKTRDGYLWFDGTADQFESNYGGPIAIIENQWLDLLIEQVTERLGGKWQLVTPRV